MEDCPDERQNLRRAVPCGDSAIRQLRRALTLRIDYINSLRISQGFYDILFCKFFTTTIYCICTLYVYYCNFLMPHSFPPAAKRCRKSASSPLLRRAGGAPPHQGKPVVVLGPVAQNTSAGTPLFSSAGSNDSVCPRHSVSRREQVTKDCGKRGVTSRGMSRSSRHS